MKFKKEIKIGIVVTAAIAFFIYGFNFLKGSNLLKDKRTFYGVYENIDGLVRTNPVHINGLKIGQVTETKLIHDNSGRILVAFSITDRELNIPNNSIARIVSSDFLGSKAVELILGNSTVYLENKDTIRAEVQVPIAKQFSNMIEPLRHKADSVFTSIDSVLTFMQAVLNPSAQRNIAGSLDRLYGAIFNIEKTTLQLNSLVAEERVRLASIFRNVESISGNLVANNARISNIIKNTDAIADSGRIVFMQTINNANRSIDVFYQSMEKVNKGKGTLGNLIHNDTLYYNLERSSASLDSLLTDMQARPGRYVHFSVFGKKDKGPPKP